MRLKFILAAIVAALATVAALAGNASANDPVSITNVTAEHAGGCSAPCSKATTNFSYAFVGSGTALLVTVASKEGANEPAVYPTLSVSDIISDTDPAVFSYPTATLLAQQRYDDSGSTRGQLSVWLVEGLVGDSGFLRADFGSSQSQSAIDIIVDQVYAYSSIQVDSNGTCASASKIGGCLGSGNSPNALDYYSYYASTHQANEAASGHSSNDVVLGDAHGTGNNDATTLYRHNLTTPRVDFATASPAGAIEVLIS
jgi:hypothetical protein